MEYNIKCISDEINNIINNKKKYKPKVILYSLALLETILLIEKTNVLTKDFIKILKYLYLSF